MFKQLMADYRRIARSGSLDALAEARRDVAGTLHPFLVASWDAVQELAKKSPHCFQSPYYAHDGAMEELLSDDSNRLHLAQFLGVSCDDACTLYRVWAKQRPMANLSNYAGD